LAVLVAGWHACKVQFYGKYCSEYEMIMRNPTILYKLPTRSGTEVCRRTSARARENNLSWPRHPDI